MKLFNRNKKREAADNSIILNSKAPWAMQEAYKGLRTNIIFSLAGNENKIIGVSSASPSDGKSVNAINIAISFAQLGNKVLLIDTDLRRPTVASKLHVKGIPGLSNVLIGQTKFSESMHRLTEFGIDILPAGTIPPDATWLLQSEQMKNMIETMKKFYNYIIMDLPPVTTVAYASICSRYCDGFVLVVRHDVTDIRAVAEALQQLERAKAHVIGFIYNDAPEGEGGYYRYSYKYKYKYKYYKQDGENE